MVWAGLDHVNLRSPGVLIHNQNLKSEDHVELLNQYP